MSYFESDEEFRIVRSGSLVRVRSVNEDGRVVFFEHPNGAVGYATSSLPMEFAVGDLLIAGDDEFIPAPAELWRSDPWVGVVRLKLDDITVIDSGGRWQRVPTTNVVDYRRGNTVEVSDTNGVIRKLHDSPLKLVDIDLDEAVVERFRSMPSSEEASFERVGGLDEVIERAQELIEVPMQASDKLARIGARPIKGVLFTGAAGTGKTMVARIIAARSGAAFYDINGPEIFSKWYGQSEELLRLIFEDARRQEKSIIFFDELDSVASQRSDEAHEATRRVVAQLLTLMDGFDPDENVVVLAATNRPGDIDEALRRPGRLDWQIEFPVPSRTGREDILRKSAVGKSVTPELPYSLVADRSEGWTGAELVAIWKEAALLAVTDERDVILSEDFIGGWQRVSSHRLLRQQTSRRTA